MKVQKYNVVVVVLFNDTSTLIGHFMSSLREGDKREGRKRRIAESGR